MKNARGHVQDTNLLIRLRAKPDHIKQRIALALTLIIFCGILFVWVSSWDARTHDQEVRDKTVAPINSITTLFNGFVSGFKEKITVVPGNEENVSATTSTATSTDNFDLSGVVIIDPSATTTKEK